MDLLSSKVEILTGEKLLRIFPSVLSVNTTYAETANVVQATSEINVDMCVTLANLSKVGVRKLPYIKREL
jgi:hypothetical protein